MLNNFCFHVYAQKSLFIAENCNALSTDIRVHRAGSQLKRTPDSKYRINHSLSLDIPMEATNNRAYGSKAAGREKSA